MTEDHPSTDDWVIGLCWICEGDDTPVKWMGPVSIPLGEVPMFACRPCRKRLAGLAAQIIKETDLYQALVAR